MKKLAFLLVGLLYMSNMWGQCADPDNIHHFIFNEHSYLVVKELKTWTDAASCAIELGGYLVHIESGLEQDAVFKAITGEAGVATDYVQIFNGGGIAYVWIGATDQHEEGLWIWDGDNNNEGPLFWSGQGANGYNDGKVHSGSYVNWGGIAKGGYNEPDDYGGQGQDHAAIGLTGWPEGTTTLGSPGEWNDIVGNSQIYFVVEYDSVISPLGLSGHGDVGRVKIYPNPAKTEIHAEAELLESMELLSVQGKILKFSQNTPMPVEDLAPGFYLLRVNTLQHSYLEKILIH